MVKLELKAATLIEALVASIIVLIAFVMGIFVYVNVMTSDNGFQKERAASLIRKTVYDDSINKSYVDSKIKQGDIVITKSISNYSGVPSAIVLTIKATDSMGHKLGYYNEIVNEEN
jgi:hypothetical protein